MSDTDAVTTLPTGEVVVRLAGEIDLKDQARLARLFRRAMDRSPRVIVDVTDLAFIDCTALARLLWARERAHSRGGTLVLAGACPSISRLLVLTGLADLLPLHPGIASATTAMHRRSDWQVRPREQTRQQPQAAG